MNKFHGIFKQLFELQLPGTEALDLYEGYYAQLYEALTSRDNYDIPIVLKQARVTGGPVLELASGTARIVKHIANAGYTVTGVDLSDDMLSIARKKTEMLPQRIKKNITLHQGNMIDFQVDEQFALVILTATSISLLKDEEEVECMFNNIYKHLKDGGRFVFDLLDDESFENSSLRMGGINAITLNQSPIPKQFILMGEQRDANNSKRALMNFYSEVITEDRTYRFFGSTEKTYFPYDTILPIIGKTGFKIIQIEKKELAQNEMVYMFVLEK